MVKKNSKERKYAGEMVTNSGQKVAIEMVNESSGSEHESTADDFAIENIEVEEISEEIANESRPNSADSKKVPPLKVKLPFSAFQIPKKTTNKSIAEDQRQIPNSTKEKSTRPTTIKKKMSAPKKTGPGQHDTITQIRKEADRAIREATVFSELTGVLERCNRFNMVKTIQVCEQMAAKLKKLIPEGTFVPDFNLPSTLTTATQVHSSERETATPHREASVQYVTTEMLTAALQQIRNANSEERTPVREERLGLPHCELRLPRIDRVMEQGNRRKSSTPFEEVVIDEEDVVEVATQETPREQRQPVTERVVNVEPEVEADRPERGQENMDQGRRDVNGGGENVPSLDEYMRRNTGNNVHDSDLVYHSCLAKIKIKPLKLCEQMEFRLWFDQFSMYVSQFPWKNTFNLENPIHIPEDQIQMRIDARAALCAWLDETHLKLIFGEQNPAVCLQKLKFFKEPISKMANQVYLEITKMCYNPSNTLFADWCVKFEELSRTLMTSYEGWDENRKLRCFLDHMELPFPNIRIYTEQRTKRDLCGNIIHKCTYEEAKRIAIDEDHLLRERKDLFKLDKLAAKVVDTDAKIEEKVISDSVKIPLEKRMCYKCRRMGHLAKDCRVPAYPQREERYINNNERRNERRRRSTSRRRHAQREHVHHSRRHAHAKNRHQHRRHGAHHVRRNRSVSCGSSCSCSGSLSVSRSRSRSPQGKINVIRLNKENILKCKLNKANLKFMGDTGASETYTNVLENLLNATKLSNPIMASSANINEEADIRITHKGDMCVKDWSGKPFVLKGVMYSKDLSDNLLSIRRIVEQGYQAIMMAEKCEIIDPKTRQLVFEGKMKNGYWWFEFEKLNKPSMHVLQQIEQTNEAGCPKQRNQDPWSESEEEDIKHQDHDYLAYTGQERITDENLLEFIDLGAEITVSELDKFENIDHMSLRKKLGLLYHVRLGHASINYLEQAKKTFPVLKNIDFAAEIQDCSVCKVAKITRQPHKKTREMATSPLHRVHSDLMGPIKPKGLFKNSLYVVTFTDDYSRHTMTFNIQDKTVVAKCFEEYLNTMRGYLGDGNAKIFYLRIDGGTEYMTAEMKKIIRAENIIVEMTPPDTPQLNGVAERVNRTIINKVRAMLVDSGLPTAFWEFAVLQTVHIHNRLPHKRLNFKTPYELIKQRLPSINHIKRFGCIAYRRFPYNKTSLSKFDPRGEKCVLLGCNTESWQLLNPKTGKLYFSSDIEATESRVFKDDFSKNYFENRGTTNLMEPTIDDQSEVQFRDGIPGEYLTPSTSTVNKLQPKRKLDERHCVCTLSSEGCKKRKLDNSCVLPLEKLENLTLKETRETSELAEIKEQKYFIMMCEINGVPRSYRDVLGSKDRNRWLEAIKKELRSQDDNKTWEYVRRPGREEKVIDSRWVFVKKTEADGGHRFKARLVIRGFKDHHQYDLSEIYAPVAGITDVRLLLAIANKAGWKIEQMDVETAFLNGKLNKYVYMEIPEGVKVTEEFRKKHVCLVKRALYGLKVSPKVWYLRFKEAMIKLNFYVHEGQACVFHWSKGGQIVIVMLYVDDILVTGSSPEKILETKRRLCAEFKMKILGEPRKFLGIEIQRDMSKGELSLNQTKFIDKILDRFGMSHVYGSNTPMCTNQAERKRQHEPRVETTLDVNRSIPYREAVGCLLYLTTCTRPDLAFSVNQLTRKCHDFSLKDWKKVEKVLKYVAKTKELQLKYLGKGNELVGYSDASLGMNDPDGLSTSGNLILLYNDAIFWSTKRQREIAQSSMEAEYLALNKLSKEMVYIQKLCELITRKRFLPTLFEDNSATIEAVKSGQSGALRHLVKLKYKYVSQKYQEGEFNLVWVSSKNQLADLFTKSLPCPSFSQLRDIIFNEI